jgi:predicted permease
MFTVLSVSFTAVLRIVLICLAGTWLARRGVLDRAFCRALSRLILHLMLPCLLISKLSASASGANLARWALLPASALLYVGVGFAVGSLMVWIIRPPPAVRRLVTAATAFGNSGYIPYPLVTALAATAPILATDAGAGDRGVAYISVYLLCMSPCLWGIGYPYLAHQPLSSLRREHFLSPPIISALIGLALGLLPPLHALFVANGAPLRVFIDAAGVVGDGVIPCALIVLGANLADTPAKTAELPLRSYVGVACGRLFIMPLFGCLYVLALSRFGLLPADPMFALVLLIESAVPAATNLMVMCQVHERSESAMAWVLVVNNLLAIVTLSLFGALFLWLLPRL